MDTYQRAGRKTRYFMAHTETGRKQLSTGTSSKVTAGAIAATWYELAQEHRAWELLAMVLSGAVSIGRLYDAWVASGRNVIETRRLLADADVTIVVEDWIAIHRREVKRDSADHALVHVRHFFPSGKPVLASTVTTEWLVRRLGAYAGKRNTIRKVHSSVSGFLQYCTNVKALFALNPMMRVARPRVETSPTRFYDIDVVERIVGAQPSVERRAVFALLYGTGIEVSVAIALTRSDLDVLTKQIRAAGTKAHTRDRMCLVAEWAWPILWEHARHALPAASLFPTYWSRHTVSDWHRQTVGNGTKDRHGAVATPGLNLRDRHPLHCARDHWAVRALRVGTPIAVVQAQLGHGSPMLTLSKYGRFMPSAADRKHWEAAATEYDQQRRASK
jgi:integrase